MKTEELKAKGLTDEQISFVMAENGKDVNGLKNQITSLTADRDSWKDKFTTSEEALKKFDGKNPDELQKQIDALNQTIKDKDAEYQKQIYERDFASALETAMADVKFTSNFAKESAMAKIKEQGLKMMNGKIIGLNDCLAVLKENDPSAFVDEQQQQNNAGKAKFVDKGNNGGRGSAITKEDFAKMTIDEKINLKANDPELYASLRK